MFLLLAPSLLTGKRPGLYCPGGRGSQDAPKGPKGEVRGWIGRHDKELTTPTTTHAPLKKQNIKIASFFSLTCHDVFHLESKSLSRVSGNEIGTMLRLTISY